MLIYGSDQKSTVIHEMLFFSHYNFESFSGSNDKLLLDFLSVKCYNHRVIIFIPCFFFHFYDDKLLL